MDNCKEHTLLVIPELNDAERLRPFLLDICTDLPSHFHVQIVDDGSTQKNKERLNDLIIQSQKLLGDKSCKILKPIYHEKNKGKGGAIRTGWDCANSTTQILGFVDADGSIGTKDIIKMEEDLKKDPTIAALWGSRIEILGYSIKRHKKRMLTSLLFQIILRKISSIKAHDTQCGFKYIRKDAYNLIKPMLTTNGYCLDVELTMLLL